MAAKRKAAAKDFTRANRGGKDRADEGPGKRKKPAPPAKGAKGARKPVAKDARKPGAKDARKPGAKDARKPGAKDARKPGAKAPARPATPAPPPPVLVSLLAKATPAVLYRTLTQPLEWQGWLCEDARFDPKQAARWDARWMGGYEARGTFVALVSAERVAMTWEDAVNPGPTQVEFRLRPEEGGTRVEVEHTGFAASEAGIRAAAEAAKAWPRSLENLRSLADAGIDLRLARRPMVGVSFDVLAPEPAAAAGVEAGRLRLSSVTPGFGADKAGLRKDDVLLRVGRKDVRSGEDLVAEIGRYHAGERLEVVFRRGGETKKVEVLLSPRPQPDIPSDPAEVVAKARAVCQAVWAEMEQVLSGATEEETSRPEAPGKWSVKETLAHLVVAERFGHEWMTWEILGETPGTKQNPTVVPERLAGVLAGARTARDLLARFRSDVEETWAIFANLRPEVRENKARFRSLAGQVLEYPGHARTHLVQMKRILAAVRV
jgi:uncharacterized protein YndB with AHSA1/START domain